MQFIEFRFAFDRLSSHPALCSKDFPFEIRCSAKETTEEKHNVESRGMSLTPFPAPPEAALGYVPNDGNELRTNNFLSDGKNCFRINLIASTPIFPSQPMRMFVCVLLREGLRSTQKRKEISDIHANGLSEHFNGILN